MEAVNIFTVKKLVPLYKGEGRSIKNRINAVWRSRLVVLEKDMHQKGRRWCYAWLLTILCLRFYSWRPKKSYLGNIKNQELEQSLVSTKEMECMCTLMVLFFNWGKVNGYLDK